MSKMKLLLDVVEDLRTLATSLESLANAATAMDAEPETQPAPATIPSAAPPPTQPTAIAEPTTEPKLTIVELRAFVAERSTPENRPLIKAILTSHGVAKLTELPEEKYQAVMQEVADL